MKKASTFFKGFVSKGKSMFNTKKEGGQAAAATTVDNGFDSGEDDDLIEIGKHKGAA